MKEQKAFGAMRRVVITGMGVDSLNGIGKDAFCCAVLAGKSGVRRITRFDPSDLTASSTNSLGDGA